MSDGSEMLVSATNNVLLLTVLLSTSIIEESMMTLMRKGFRTVWSHMPTTSGSPTSSSCSASCAWFLTTVSHISLASTLYYPPQSGSLWKKARWRPLLTECPKGSKRRMKRPRSWSRVTLSSTLSGRTEPVTRLEFVSLWWGKYHFQNVFPAEIRLRISVLSLSERRHQLLSLRYFEQGKEPKKKLKIIFLMHFLKILLPL